MNGGLIAALVVLLVLVLVGAGVGIWYAVTHGSDAKTSFDTVNDNAGSTGLTVTTGNTGSESTTAGREYMFYKNLDSGGNDMPPSPYLFSSAKDLLTKCDSLPGCIGANTKGYLKFKVGSLAPHANFTGSTDGIYILKDAATAAGGVAVNSATASTAAPPVTSGYPKRTYNFYQGVDAAGNDLVPPSPYIFSNTSDLLQKCNATPGCIAANTLGWIKNSTRGIAPASAFSGEGKGMYILADKATGLGTPTSVVTEHFEQFVNW